MKAFNKAIILYFFFRICNPAFLCYADTDSIPSDPVRKDKKIFSFGVIADVQYADLDSLRGRYFRSSVERLKACVEDFNTRNLNFTIQLGDIINGHGEEIVKTREELDSIVRVAKHLRMPLYHVIGNHDMTAGRKYLQASLGIRRFYYDFTNPSARGWRFIVLDGNDGGYGIMTEKQMNWFRSVINKSIKRNEKVICFCHYALIRSAAGNHYMAKPGPILNILDHTACVTAWIAGHDHAGGYASRNGIHHITLKGMVEAPGVNSYAIVEFFRNMIIITGFGKEVSREFPIRNN
jgi:predicted phosphodiesterase